mgnify:CR=1 FL=1
MRVRARRTQGIAALTALLVMGLVTAVGTMMVTRALTEVETSVDDVGIVRSLALARGTANLAGALLQGPVRGALHAIVEGDSSSGARWSFGSGAVGADRPDPDAVAVALTGGSGSVASRLQADVDALVCDAALPDVGEDASVSLRIHLTDVACGEGLPPGVTLGEGRFVSGEAREGSGAVAEQRYALPYVVVAVGEVDGFRRSIVSYGEYQFLVGRASFARYALFSGNQQTRGGAQIWFTSDTLFDGPVHSNEHFNFYRQPWFGGEVTSAGCFEAGVDGCAPVPGPDREAGAFFFPYFQSVATMADPTAPAFYSYWYGLQRPELTEGVDWEASFVPLPENAQQQQAEAEASGLAIMGDVEGMTLYAGSADGTPVDAGATHQYVEVELASPTRVCTENGCSTLQGEVRWRATDDDELQREVCTPNGCYWSSEGAFNGVLYADGDVERATGPGRTPPKSDDASDAPPAVAAFSTLTLAARDDVRITGDLRYEDPPCSEAASRNPDGSVTPSTCENLDATNLLGIYSQRGDVRIGNENADPTWNAPENLEVHGTLMSAEGSVRVERFRDGPPRGTVTLLGGIIGEYYGAFGTYWAGSGAMRSGFSRTFVYDPRLEAGLAPPYFPTTTEDGVRSILVFSYAQREQLE